MEHHHRLPPAADFEPTLQHQWANEHAYALNRYQLDSQPYLNFSRRRHHKCSSSLGSESSAPGLVEDSDSDPSSEDDYDYHAAGSELWDSFWQAEKVQLQFEATAQDDSAPYRGDYAPRQSRSSPRKSQERGYYEEDIYQDYYVISPPRRDEHQWPLPNEPIQIDGSRMPLRSAASYSVFPRSIAIPPRTSSYSNLRRKSHCRTPSQPRRRPPPPPLSEEKPDMSIRQSHAKLPPIITSQSDPAALQRIPGPGSAAKRLARPSNAPPSLLQEPREVTSRDGEQNPISVFAESDDEKEPTGFAARIVRGLHNKRSMSETRRSARGSEAASAQLRRARAGTKGSDADVEERGRRPGSAEGVFGRMLGRRSRQRDGAQVE